MRRAALALVLAAALGGIAAFGAASASANSVDATCNGKPCDGWFNTSVLLHWDVSPDPNPPGCPDETVSTEGDNELACDVTWPDGGTAHQPVDVKIDLTPPTFDVSPGPDLNGWYNHPASLTVTNGADSLSGLAGTCESPPTYSGPDGASVDIGGGCTDQAGNTARVHINYDATPPVVVTAVGDRPADHDGWFNHPVSFRFQGLDGTSGIASCTTASYSGPPSANAVVSGACTDVAGNVGVGTFVFPYDNVRPAAAQVQVTPGNRRVRLTWSLPPDARIATVTRSEQGTTASPTLVYAGARTTIADKGLKNGTKYRYTITDTDLAGNSSSSVVRAIPTASSLRPYVGAVVSGPPRLTWKTVKGARYYNVQLFFGNKKVLSTWPRKPSLQLKPSWHFRSQTYNFVPGHYRWYVWPGFGPLSAHHYGHRLGRSSFRAV